MKVLHVINNKNSSNNNKNQNQQQQQKKYLMKNSRFKKKKIFRFISTSSLFYTDWKKNVKIMYWILNYIAWNIQYIYVYQWKFLKSFSIPLLAYTYKSLQCCNTGSGLPKLLFAFWGKSQLLNLSDEKLMIAHKTYVRPLLYFYISVSI